MSVKTEAFEIPPLPDFVRNRGHVRLAELAISPWHQLEGYVVAAGAATHHAARGVRERNWAVQSRHRKTLPCKARLASGSQSGKTQIRPFYQDTF